MRWFLIWWVFVLGAVAYLDRVNISVAGSSIAAEYGLSNVQLGYVFSSFLVGYAVFQTPCGRLADRFGPRRVIALAVIWWGIFTALTACVPVRTAGRVGPLGILLPLLLFIPVRFLLGAGEAFIYPASNHFVANWIPTSERGLANGLIFSGVGAGAGLAPPLVTYIMIHRGWRASFWVSAAIGLVAGAVWFIAARDNPDEHPRMTASELARIKAGLTFERQAHNQGERLPWGTILRSREVLATTLSYFSYGYAAWIFFAWFFTYLAQVRGLNLKASAEFAMLPFLAMAGGSTLGGFLSDRLTRRFNKRLGRCVFACVALLLAAAFLAAGPRLESAAMASVVLAGGAGAVYLSQSAYWSVTADIAGNSSGSVSGLMNMGGQIGGAVTASLTPAIAGAYGWTASFLVAAVLCSLGGLAWLVVNPERSLAIKVGDG